MKRIVPLLVSALLLACPGGAAPPPDPAPTGGNVVPRPEPQPEAPPPSAKLTGGWTVHVTSDQRPLDPASVDTPEKRAKVLYDHRATVADNRVTVEHKTLGKSFDAKESIAVELDDVLTTADWEKIAVKTGLEEGIATGTIYTLVVTKGDKTFEIKTARADVYPEVKKVLDLLRAVAGAP
jgi:hypothetical protein